MVLGFVYLFVIIPSFQSSSSLVQCIIRVFGHTFIKGQSDVRQRDGFARNKQSKTAKAACGNMFAMECVWAIAGRFLISGAVGSYNWYLLTLLSTAYMEWFMRVNSEPLEYLWLVYISGLPPLTGRSLNNFRIAEACSQAQDDAVEQGAIVIVGVVQLLLFNQRSALGLGLVSDVAPAFADLIMVIGMQLAIEIPTDILTTAQLVEDGLNLHEYYRECEEDSVITQHTLMHKVNESCCFGLGLFASMLFFRIAPIPLFCDSGNICSCSFYQNELAKLCGVRG